MIKRSPWGDSSATFLISTDIQLGEEPHIAHDARLRRMVDDFWQPLGRILRTLGVPDADIDDALQQVYVTAAAKLAVIEEGKERAFLVQVAVNVAARVRRSRGRSRETPSDEIELDATASATPADEQLDRDRALAMLSSVLDGMDDALRTVFVLYEIEEMTMADIAQSLDVPQGTVASRLRRARAEFEEGVARMQRRGAR